MSDTDDLTEAEVKELRELLSSWKTYNLLGRLTWKIIVATGAAVAGLAAFKDHIWSLFGKG